jgi:hypothetical protein
MMAKRTTPTFMAGDELLRGAAAIAAWKEQEGARCACGSYGSADHAVSGTAGDMPAKWLGCTNCTASAVGRPLIYRLNSQMPG